MELTGAFMAVWGVIVCVTLAVPVVLQCMRAWEESQQRATVRRRSKRTRRA